MHQLRHRPPIQPASRYDARRPARITTGLAIVGIAVNVNGILSTAEGWPRRWDLPRMLLGAATGISFLTWLARARAAIHPPSYMRDHPDWTITSDGRFTAADLSVNADSIPATTRRSGAGAWEIDGDKCSSDAPGICLALGDAASEIGWTVGTRSSPVLQFPVFPPGEDPDNYPVYEVRRAR